MGLGLGNIVWFGWLGDVAVAETTGSVVELDVAIGQAFCAAVNITQALSADADISISAAQCSDISASIDTDADVGIASSQCSDISASIDTGASFSRVLDRETDA